MIRKIACMHILLIVALQGACDPKASIEGESLWKQLDRILSVSYAGKMIYQSDIPYVIAQSGTTYGIGENLSSEGTATVITVAAGVRDIVIDLHGHTITANGGSDAAISINSQRQSIIVQNGTISGFNIGIYRAFLVKNMILEQCATGLSGCRYAETSNGINCGSFFSIQGVDAPGGLSGRVLKCDMFNSTDYGIIADGIVFLAIDQCSFYGGNGGIRTLNMTRGPIIIESVFDNITGTAISIESGSTTPMIRGCSIEGCTNGIEFLDPLSTTMSPTVLNTTISNCSGTGISVGSGISVGTLRGNRITNVNIGILMGTSSLSVYNNYISDAAITFSGFSPAQATTSQIGTLANYWTNVFD